MSPASRAGLVLIAVVALTACKKAPPTTVDQAGLDEIATEAEAQLNEPATAIFELLKELDKPSPIGMDALVLQLDNKTTPIDWWVWRKGLVETLPALPGGPPTFLLTTAARAQFTADLAWFEVTLGEPSRVDCQSPAALEALGCEVDVSVTPTVTTAAKPFASQPQMGPVNVHVLIAPTGEGWEVRQMTVDGPSLHDAALTALLGNNQAREFARQQAMSDLKVRQQFAVPDRTQTQTPSEAYIPPPATPADIAPVGAVIGDSPTNPPPRRVQ